MVFAARGWPGLIHPVGASHTRAERETAGEGFAEADQIWNDPGVLAREPASGAAEAGVHLVEHEQCAELVGQRPKALEESDRAECGSRRGLGRVR
jgi:hypothetical protein